MGKRRFRSVNTGFPLICPSKSSSPNFFFSNYDSIGSALLCPLYTGFPQLSRKKNGIASVTNNWSATLLSSVLLLILFLNSFQQNIWGTLDRQKATFAGNWPGPLLRSSTGRCFIDQDLNERREWIWISSFLYRIHIIWGAQKEGRKIKEYEILARAIYS